MFCTLGTIINLVLVFKKTLNNCSIIECCKSKAADTSNTFGNLNKDLALPFHHITTLCNGWETYLILLARKLDAKKTNILFLNGNRVLGIFLVPKTDALGNN